MPDDPSARFVACVGCGGRVPDEEGPIHRYMTASPGCWRIYTELGATGFIGGASAPLSVDAYAVTHPGQPGPQSTPSVWIHLLALCFVLDRGWSVDQAIRLRRVAADAFDGWPWLERPDSMGDVTVVDVACASEVGDGGVDLVEAWVGSAWAAWSDHHRAVGSRADELTQRFFA